MVSTVEKPDVRTLPLTPKNPLPYRKKLSAVRSFIEGAQEPLDAGGPITRIVLGPKWLMPQAVMIATPQGARDLLGRTDEVADRGRTRTMIEMHRLMGGNLLDLPHQRWLPRRRALQPMFTKRQTPRYAGHMAAAAQAIADGWQDDATVDLDTECRLLTLRALGRSVLGLDLDERADEVGQPLRDALTWVADRGVRPLNPPRWLPSRGQRRARKANHTLHRLAAERCSTQFAMIPSAMPRWCGP
jgi:cytochrome P450